MASSNNLESQPQKVVIVAGPSFGNAIQFVLFGAALGAAATYALLRKKLSVATLADDAVLEGLSAGGTKESSQELVERLKRLQIRLRALASRTKDTVQTAGEVLGPAISQAVAEGKKAAHDIENDLEQELKNPPPTPEADAEKPNIASEQA